MKRRMISLVLCLCMAITLLPARAVAAAAAYYGDADGNHVVDLRDVLLIEKYFQGEPVTVSLSRADVNLDGKADMTDADAIREYLVGTRKSLTPVHCTVRFDPNGGDPVAPISAVVGFPIAQELPTPAKENVIFTGWTLGGARFYKDEYILTGDITLTASYMEIDAAETLYMDSFAVSDVASDRRFDVAGGASAPAVLAGVSLTPKDGSDPLALTVTGSDGAYSVGAADGFRPGGVYELRLLDEALAFAGEDAAYRMVSFTVAKAETDDLQYNPDLIFIQDTDAITYTMDGETTDTLTAGVSTEENAAPKSGSFTYPGTLNAGDFVCVYVGTDPRSRDYTSSDYADEPLGYLEITGGGAGSYTFTGVGSDDLDKILMMPATILYKVDRLPNGAVGDTLTADKASYDAAAMAFLGLGTPKFNPGDFLVFYVGEFSSVTEDTPVVYGQVTGTEGGTVSYDVITREDIEAFSGMFVSTPVEADKVAETLDQQAFLAKVETQARESGFIDEAVGSMTVSALELQAVQEQLQNAGFTDGEITALSASAAPYAAGAPGSKLQFEIESTTIKPTLLIGDRYENGVGVRLELGVVLGLSKKMNSVTNCVKLDLTASFEQQVHFDVNADVDLDWDWYLCVPILNEIYCGTSISIKSYSAASVSARLYTFSEANIKKWNKLYDPNDSSDYMLEHADEFKEIDALRASIKKLEKSGKDAADQLEDLNDLIADLPSIEVDGQSYSPLALMEELGMSDVSSSFDEVLSAEDEDSNRVGIQKIMDKYSQMLESECEMLQLVNKELFSKTYNLKVLAIKLSVNLVIRLKANVTIGADVEYEVGKRYDFWIKVMAREAGSSETDLLDERFGFQFYVMGNIGLRMGIKASVDFGLISTDVASIGANMEFGPYLELWGYFFYIYARTRPANGQDWQEQEEMQGALYMEFGLYLLVKFKAQALLDAVKYEPTLVDEKFPLLSAGERLSVYDFARYPKQDEALRIYDENTDPSDGISRTLPESYLLMKYMDLVTGAPAQAIYDYGKFHYELTDSRFSIDGNTGLITVAPDPGSRYMEASLRIIWKSDKLAFSKYDTDITLKLVWTNMTNKEITERFAVTVDAGSVQDGYRTVWSDVVGRLDVFDLPAAAELLTAASYDRYTYNGVNLYYSGVGGYADSVTQTKDISLYADTRYLYELPRRQYQLTVTGVQNADGTETQLELYANYGNSFDLSALKDTGTSLAGQAYTQYIGLSADGGKTLLADGAAADLSFYEKYGGFEAVLSAQYADATRTLTVEFLGLDAAPVTAEVKFKSGMTPDFDIDAFINEYIQAHPGVLADGCLMRAVSCPDIKELDSSMKITIVCEQFIADPVTLRFETNGGSEIADRVAAAGYKANVPTPAKTGYDFSGWYTDARFAESSKFDFTAMDLPDGSGAMTFYAKWSPKRFTVTLDTRKNNITYDHSVAYHEAYGALPTPEDANDYFLGWFTQAAGGTEVTAETIFTGLANTTLYAHWSGKRAIADAEVLAAVRYTAEDYAVTVSGVTATIPAQGPYTYGRLTPRPFLYTVDDDAAWALYQELYPGADSSETAETAFRAMTDAEQLAALKFHIVYINEQTEWREPTESTDAPITAGSYLVKLTRATDDYNLTYEKVLGDPEGESKHDLKLIILKKQVDLSAYDLTAHVDGMSMTIELPYIEGDGELTYEYRFTGPPRTQFSSYSTPFTASSPSIALQKAAMFWQVRLKGADSENYEYKNGGWIDAADASAMSNVGFTAELYTHTADVENAWTHMVIRSNLVYPVNPSPTGAESALLYADTDFTDHADRNEPNTFHFGSNLSPWMVGGFHLAFTGDGDTDNKNWYPDTLQLIVSYQSVSKYYTATRTSDQPWLGDAGGDYYHYTTDTYRRPILETGNFPTSGSGAIDLSAETPANYSFQYNGSAKSSFYGRNTKTKEMETKEYAYNAFACYDPPTMTVTAETDYFDHDAELSAQMKAKFNAACNTALERFVKYTGAGQFAIDSAALKQYMREEGWTGAEHNFTYTVTLLFNEATTSGTTRFTYDIAVTAPTAPAALNRTAGNASVSTLAYAALQAGTMPLLAASPAPTVAAGAPTPTQNGFDVAITLGGGVPLWALLAEVESGAVMTGYTLGSDVFTADEFTLGSDRTADAWRFMANQDTLENTSDAGSLLTLHFSGSEQPVAVRLVQAINLSGSVIAGENGGWYDEPDSEDPPAPWVNPFNDVKESDWFYADVAYANTEGLMQGTSAAVFDPHGATTRGMLVTILHRLAGAPAVAGACPFDDVASGKYYENAVTWAAANKIVGGYGDGKFGPNDPITREQMATILWHYAEFKNYDVMAAADLSIFTDNEKISAWALPSMSWANANGLISGKGGGILDPGGNAERCQVAAILHRFCQRFVT